jgi:hypothetical protein
MKSPAQWGLLSSFQNASAGLLVHIATLPIRLANRAVLPVEHLWEIPNLVLAAGADL